MLSIQNFLPETLNFLPEILLILQLGVENVLPEML